MTTMIDRSEKAVESRVETMRSRSRSLWLSVAILALAVVALGTWLIYDSVQESAVAPSGEIETLLDDYTAAWNEYDGDGLLALTAPGYTYTSAGGMELDRSDTAAEIESEMAAHLFRIEQPGFPVMMGNGPWYVAVPTHTVTNIREADGIAMLTIVDDGGTLLVARHTVTGDF